MTFVKYLVYCSLVLIGIGIVLIARYHFFFLRLPDRPSPHDASLFLSPANGTIIAIYTGDNVAVEKNHRKVISQAMEDTGSGSTLISIMMTPRNVHYQRAPQAAILLKQEYHTGAFLNAMANPSATFENEYNAMLFQTADAVKFKVIQIAGFVARRIVSFVQAGQSVQQGDVIGLIKLGSQVSIVFDKNVEVVAHVGDAVVEGESILATRKYR